MPYFIVLIDMRSKYVEKPCALALVSGSGVKITIIKSVAPGLVCSLYVNDLLIWYQVTTNQSANLADYHSQSSNRAKSSLKFFLLTRTVLTTCVVLLVGKRLEMA